MLRICLLIAVAALAYGWRERRSAQSDLQSLADSLVAAWESDDSAALKANYDDNVKFITPRGKLVEGADDLMAHFKAKKADFEGTTDAKMTIGKTVADGNMAAAVGTVTMKKEGTDITMKQVMVAKKSGGSWKIVAEGLFAPVMSGARFRRDTVEAQLRNLHNAFMEKAGGGDLAGAMSDVYTSDVTYITPRGNVVEGLDNLKNHFKEKSAGKSDWATAIDTVIEDGNMAVEIGKTSFKMTKDGNVENHSLRHLAVWQKSGDKWMCAIDSLFAGDGDHVHEGRRRMKREASVADVQGRMNEIMKMWHDDDEEGLKGAYAENAKMVNPKGAVIAGRDAIFAHIKSQMAKYKGMTDKKMTVEHVVSDANVAVAIGTFSGKMEGNEKKMRLLIVLKKDGDSWVVRGEVIFPGAGGAAHHRRRFRRSVEETISRLHADGIALLKEGKVDEALDLWYNDDTKYIDPHGGLHSGKADVAAHFKSRMASVTVKDISTTIDKVYEDGNLVMEVGQTTFTFEKDGEEMSRKMRHFAVWKKDGDSYKVAIDGNLKIHEGSSSSEGD